MVASAPQWVQGPCVCVTFDVQALGACLVGGVGMCHVQQRSWADRRLGCAPGVISTERGAHMSPREGPRQIGRDSWSQPASSALGP